MPGAYEKQMTGARYDRMVERVKQCRALLQDESKHQELMEVALPLLTVEVGKDKKSVEEFCYAEGLHVMCEVMETRPSHSSLGDVSIILSELSALLCIEHNTFDDDIGLLPLLVFFLCERHKYYVDINWMSHELSFMKMFVNAIISLLSTPMEDTRLPNSTRLAAISVLYMSLLTFPPHRVVAQTAECFHAEGCTKLMSSVRALELLKETAKDRRRLSQLIASVCFFGLGLQLTWELTHSQLLYATSVNLGKDLRCPCGRCEFHRRLQKVARDRDEFGVIKANESKRGICVGFILGNGVDVVLDIFITISKEFRKNKVKCTFNPLIPKGTAEPVEESSAAKETDAQSDSDAESESDESVKNMDKKSDAGDLSMEYHIFKENNPTELTTPHTTSPPTPESSPCASPSCETATGVCSSSLEGNPCGTIDTTEQRLQQRKDLIASSVDDNDPRLDDEARQLCSWVILLCSWPYQKLYGRSILTHKNYQLLAALLSAIDLSDLRRTFDSETCTFLPGVRTTLEVISTLILQAEANDREYLLTRSKPTMEALLRRTSEKLVDKCGINGEGWRPSMGQYAPLLCGMVQQIYLATSMGNVSTYKQASSVSKRNVYGIDEATVGDEKAVYKGQPSERAVKRSEVANSNGRMETMPKETASGAAAVSPSQSSTTQPDDHEFFIEKLPLPKINKMNRATSKACVAACQTLLDGYEYLGVDIDAKTFLCSLIASMAVLVDTMVHIKLPERRRRFLSPPDVMCGWMANGARRVHELYMRLCPDDGCVFVRETANTVIVRAEKASALIPAELGDPAEKLRNAVIDHVNKLKSEGLWGTDEAVGEYESKA